MDIYMLSYDLEGRAPAEYLAIGQRLEDMGAERVLDSQWIIQSPLSPDQLLGKLRDAVGARINDRYLVTSTNNVLSVGQNLHPTSKVKIRQVAGMISRAIGGISPFGSR